MRAEIRIGVSIIMLGDPDEKGTFHDPQSVGLHVYIENVDAQVAQAVSAGAKAIQPIQDMFYGDRMGMLEDPFGHIWVLLTHKEDIYAGGNQRRGETMFKQGNA